MSEESAYALAIDTLRAAKAQADSNADFKAMLAAKASVLERYQGPFRSAATIDATMVKEFLSFKNNRHWSGLHRHGGKLTAALPAFRKALGLLVDEKRPLAARIDEARQLVDGLGPAVVSAFLIVAAPDRYGVLNATSEAFAKRLGLLPSGWTMWSVGERYVWFNDLLTRLAAKLDVDFWTLDALWWIAEGVAAGGRLSPAGSAAAGELDISDVLATWLATAEKDQAIRDDAEAKARAIIQQNLGRLTEPHLRDFLRHINTCRSDSGKVNFNRFSLAFVGHNANKLVGALPQLNPLIERLWTAPNAELSGVIDAFLADAPPGAGLGFPTMVLHLRSPGQYAVWTDGLERIVQRVLDVPAHERSGAGYLDYCGTIQGFLSEHGIAASLYDRAMWVLDQAKTSSDHSDEVAGHGTDKGATPGAFVGFVPDTFAFMAELLVNNRDDWFDQNRDRFHESVAEPLRSLVQDIGTRVIHGLAPHLETAAKSGKTISKIRKNTWGKKTEGGYQPWFWAAFYRRDRTRHTDAQLFVDITANGVSHGFFVSESAPDVMQRLAAACATRPALVNTIIAALLADGFSFGASDAVAVDAVVEVVESAADLARILKAAAAVKVSKSTSPGGACAEGTALADRVGDDLRQLYPLFALATEEAPPDSIVDFLRDDPELVAESMSAPAITFATLHERTFLDGPFFSRIDRLLTDKRQVIFHGPPGTGKTLVALEYGAYLAQHGGEVTTVQFHPSYGYEDFVEGLRPVVDGGQLQYRVVPGIFRSLCDKARRNPKARFVLVVDEINRGNLPRIFGELLFLLERRDQSVVLPYSKETFSVPDNVIVIGTMNSADRSIALLDLALRRRFHFVSMAPSEGILRSWLAANGRPLWLADLLATLNGQLEASGIETERLVGHSHFMVKGIDEEGLELVWEATIQPLLAELFFARGDPLQELSLDKLLTRLPGLGMAT